MNKMTKKLIAFILCVGLIITGTIGVYADGLDDLGSIVDGSKLTNGQFVEKTVTPLARGNILNQGTARLTDNGNGTVNIYGAVFGGVVCDKMVLKLTIQQYRNGSWYNYGTYSAEAYNTATLSRSYNVSVSRGYYYRVKGACVAQRGSTTESQLPITDGLWIG